MERTGLANASGFVDSPKRLLAETDDRLEIIFGLAIVVVDDAEGSFNANA